MPRKLPAATDPETALDIAKGIEPRQARRLAGVLRARHGKAGYSEQEGLRWHRIADQIDCVKGAPQLEIGVNFPLDHERDSR